MAKYICPVCSKVWYNVNDLADCVAADAKAANDKALTEKQRIADKDELAALRKEVDKAYATLKAKTDAYNVAAQKYNGRYSDKAAILETTFASRLQKNSTNPWANVKQATDFLNGKSGDAELDKLIRNVFGY